MMRWYRRFGALAIALILVGLLLPAGVRGGPRSELVVVSGMWSPPNNFNPVFSDSAYGYYVIRFMFMSLLEARLENNQLRLFPALASKWEVGSDFQTYTFTIHPRAAWHDGRPVTAEDVLFTVSTLADPKAETNRGVAVTNLAGVDARGKRDPSAPLGFRVIGPKEFQVRTKTPVDPQGFLEQFGTLMYIMPRHILGDVPPEQLSRHPFMQNPTVGNGPYKFVQYKTDQYVELLVNEHYHLGAPSIRRLFVRIIPPTVMMAQLERGDMDITAGAGIGSILLDDWDRVKTMPHVRALSFPLPGYQFMVFNFQRPYLDKRVRRAMAHAVNRPLMINQLLKGEATLAEGPIPPTNPYFNQNVKPWAYDTARARALLQEAGWDANRTLVLRVPTGNIIRERSADIIRENLIAVGIRTEIQKSDFPTHLAAIQRGDYDLALVGWTGGVDPDVSQQFRTGATYNWLGRMSIAQMDQLLDEGKAIADPAKRRPVYHKFQEVFADELPYLVLYYENARNVIARRMSNVLHDIAGFYVFRTYIWQAAPQ